MNRFPGKLLLITALISLLLPGPVQVRGMIWCIGAEGTSRVEYAPEGCGADDPCSEGSGDERQWFPAQDEHCNSCLDLPVSPENARPLSSGRTVSAPVPPCPPPSAFLTHTSDFTAGAHRIRPPPLQPISISHTSLRSTILLI